MDDVKKPDWVPLRKVDVMVDECRGCPFIGQGDPPSCMHGLSGGNLMALVDHLWAAEGREGPMRLDPPRLCPLRACDATVHLMTDEERRQHESEFSLGA